MHDGHFFFGRAKNNDVADQVLIEPRHQSIRFGPGLQQVINAVVMPEIVDRAGFLIRAIDPSDADPLRKPQDLHWIKVQLHHDLDERRHF